MDAREKLRRYLEQRRDMGERELILDGMSVEEVMRIVGAGGGPPRQATAPTGRPVDPVPSQRASSATDSPPASSASPESADWRQILRGTGSEPSTSL